MLCAMQYCQHLFWVLMFLAVYIYQILFGKLTLNILSSSDSSSMDSPSTDSPLVLSGSISDVIPSLLYLAFL